MRIDVLSGNEFELKNTHLNQLHPSTHIIIDFELLKNLNPNTISLHNIKGPQLFTDGSNIEEKLGAALPKSIFQTSWQT